MKIFKKFLSGMGILFAIAILMIILIPAQSSQAKTRKTSESSPSEGNTFVLFKGIFKTAERQAALDRINEIRLEACKEGVRNPSTGNPLTEADYVPIKWASDLERIAQTRAAEGDIYWSHSRPNGKDCFTVKYNGTQSWAEVLAWNFNGDMVSGVNQWYGEKKDWVEQTGAVTGHYTAMINPRNKYVGLGAFVLSGEGYICISGEFSSFEGLEEGFVGVTGVYSQVIEIPNSKLTAVLENATVNKGKTKKLTVKMKYTNENSWFSGDYITGYVYDKIKWKSSDKKTATVSSKGKVKGKKTGTVSISASFGKDWIVSSTIAVQ